MLFRQWKARHADNRAIGILALCVNEAEISRTENVAVQNEARIVVQRRVYLIGHQNPLGAVRRYDPNIVLQNL
jgi:hypothetical protein